MRNTVASTVCTATEIILFLSLELAKSRQQTVDHYASTVKMNFLENVICDHDIWTHNPENVIVCGPSVENIYVGFGLIPFSGSGAGWPWPVTQWLLNAFSA